MVNNPIWSPSNHSTILLSYINFLKNKNIHRYSNYNKLHKWSINNKEEFWKSIWNFTDIIGDLKKPILQKKHAKILDTPCL